MGLRDRLAGLSRRAASQLVDSSSEDRLLKSDESMDQSANVGPIQTRANIGGELDLPNLTADDPRALSWDPFALVEQVGYKEKPTAVTYGTLQAMVWKMPVVQAVIQTRVNQCASFAVPMQHRFEPGFRVRMRESDKRPTRAARKYMRELEALFMSCGVLQDARDTRHRDSFEAFIRKLVRDSLTYDQMCFEVVSDRRGRPAMWTAVDASTIRLADTRRLTPVMRHSDEITRVQIYDSAVIAEFTTDELCFGIRNPRTDLRSQGYGTSELEMLIPTITSLLWSMQYNSNAFSQGSLQKGILNLVGAIPEKQLRAFRRLWYQQVSGVENAWRTPITNADKLEWINLQANNKDMEFSAWMDFLIKVVCAVYQMDPIEVNFKYGAGGAKSMFDSSNRAKLTESKDRGLRPMLRFLAREFDKYIIHPLDPDFTFEFVGLDSQTPKELADLQTQRVRTIYTIDEMRAEQDLPPLPNGTGQLILDANWIANKREIEQKKIEELQTARAAAQAAAVPTQNQIGNMGDAPATVGTVGAAAQQVVPDRSGGPAPGASPAAGKDPSKDDGPSEDQIARLEGLLTPSRTSRVDRA